MAFQYLLLQVAEGAELVAVLGLILLESLPSIQKYLRRVRTSLKTF
jgi:hypothetical protein